MEFIKGVSQQFFKLLYNIYKPLLSPKLLRTTRYTIYEQQRNFIYPIGFMAYGIGNFKHCNFLQLSFIPLKRHNMYSAKVIAESNFLQTLDDINIAIFQENYPALKTLKNMNGFIYEKEKLPTNQIVYRGVFNKNKIIKISNNLLDEAIIDSIPLYNEWLQLKFNKRKDQLKIINQYVIKNRIRI